MNLVPCHSAIHYCKIHLFPFSFGSVNRAFSHVVLTVPVCLLNTPSSVPKGLISAPVNVKVPMWSSGFSTALDARDKLMAIIKDKLENDTQG